MASPKLTARDAVLLLASLDAIGDLAESEAAIVVATGGLVETLMCGHGHTLDSALAMVRACVEDTRARMGKPAEEVRQ
jgi:hypothetical protein